MTALKRVKLMRGNEASRLSVTPAQGEQIMTTDEQKLYLGDGNKAGGFVVNADSTLAVWPDQSDATKKLSLAWWIAYFNGNEATIRIPRGTHEVLYDMTVPENICLKFDKGAILKVADTKTLTINGSIEAGLWQIFSGEGTITGVPLTTVVFPEWFGAIGNGETDDTNALQKAINFIANGGRIHLTSNYTKTATIIINSSDIDLTADINSSIIDTQPDISGIVISTGCKNIIFNGVRLFGSCVGESQAGVAISCGAASHDITFQHCYFDGYNMGIIYQHNNYNMTVESCSFYNMLFVPGLGAGGYGIVYQGSYNTKTINNYFDASVYRHHLYIGKNPVEPDTHGDNHVVVGNIFMGQKSGTYATQFETRVKIMGNRNVTVTGNVFDGGISHIMLDYIETPCENIIISGNTFKNLYKSGNYCCFISEHSGSFATAAQNVMIANNVFQDSDGGSILMSDYLSEFTFNGNTIKNLGASSSGLFIQNGLQNAQICNNSFYTPTTSSPIYIIAATDITNSNILIANNLIFGSGSLLQILNNFSEIYIKNNILKTTFTAGVAIYFSGAAEFTGEISNNTILGGNYSISIPNTGSRAFIYGNRVNKSLMSGIGPYCVKPKNTYNIGSIPTVETYGSAAPTTGAWYRGDVVWNDFTTSALYLGWVCTTAGAPGSWKYFGVIQTS